MAVPKLFDILAKRREVAAMPQQTSQPNGKAPGTVTEIPKIDSNDVLGSLTGILGPTPEERAAEEQKLQEHRQKMHGWTALFNGLRHLSNLYYATKGAPGQKFSDPHQQIEQQYQDERKRLADIHAADRNYYTNLWGLYRQVNDEQRKNALAEAQAQYYGTRDEVARQKAELDKLKAVRVIKNKDGSLMKFDPISGEAEPLTEADPLYQEYVRSQINRNYRTGTGRSSVPYKDHYVEEDIDPATGKKIKKYVAGRYGGSSATDKKKKYSKYKKDKASAAGNKWSKYKK